MQGAQRASPVGHGGDSFSRELVRLSAAIHVERCFGTRQGLPLFDVLSPTGFRLLPA